jgi:hypothetical protein
MMQTKLILIAAGALASLACSGGDPVNMGENNPVKSGELLSDYAATWDGYVEGYQFQSGSDRVRLTLDENGDGVLEVGDVPLLPAPSDPDIGYASAGEDPNWIAPFWIHEGFRYSVSGATVEDSRMRLAVQNDEVFAAWCELQTSLPGSEPGSYGCIPAGNYGKSDDECSYATPEGTQMSIDCGKVVLCTQVCACDAVGCTAPGRDETLLDGSLVHAGDALVGTLVIKSLVDGLDIERLTVRLERQ